MKRAPRLTKASNNNRAARQMNATRISLRKDNPYSAIKVEDTLLEVPRTSANATIPGFPKTLDDLKHIRCQWNSLTSFDA